MTKQPPPEHTQLDDLALSAHNRRVGERVARLHAIMQRLRSPEGCPWDRTQNLRSLRPYLLEETYELLETLDGDDVAAHREELGDLLFQVVFQAQLREEADQFDLGDAADAIARKLLRRHPHVFGDEDNTGDSEGVRVRWEAIKRGEKLGRRTLDGVPAELPALLQAHRVGEKAAAVGFDWPDLGSVKVKVREEIEELEQALSAGDRAAAEAELGDLLFALCQLARHLKLPPEDALRGCIARFRSRFSYVEDQLASQDRTPAEASLAVLEELWQQAKSHERQTQAAPLPSGKG